MNGSYTAKSSYADLVLEAVNGGGLLIFVHQYRGVDEGEARINLSRGQVLQMRDWLDSVSPDASE